MKTSPLAPCLVTIAVFVGLFDAPRNEPRAAAPAAVRLRSALVRHDTSPPLRDLVKTSGSPAANAVGALPARSAIMRRRATGLTLDQNFAGMTAPGGPIPNVPASDTTGAAGPNHYMQAVNFSAAIYDKTGTLVLGPFGTGQFFTGFPPCGGGWSDVVVLYDHAAQRFIVSRFAPQDTTVNPAIDWFQCFAVSQTSDPTGPYLPVRVLDTGPRRVQRLPEVRHLAGRVLPDGRSGQDLSRQGGVRGRVRACPDADQPDRPELRDEN